MTQSTTGDSGESGKKEQAKQAAATAGQEGQRVAGVAADEARKVAGEATEHARGLLDQAMGEVSDQSRTQLGRLGEVLHSVSDDLQDMVDSGEHQGVATDLTREIATRARSLGDLIQDREPKDVLDDVRRFARNRPGAFLAGAVVAGVVAGRLARAARQDQQEGQNGFARNDSESGFSSGTNQTTPTTSVAGAAGAPQPDPGYPSSAASGPAVDPGAPTARNPLTDPVEPDGAAYGDRSASDTSSQTERIAP